MIVGTATQKYALHIALTLAWEPRRRQSREQSHLQRVRGQVGLGCTCMLIKVSKKQKLVKDLFDIEGEMTFKTS